MKNASAILLVALAALLTACASPAAPSAQPNPAMDTAIAAVWTQVAGTPSPIPTLFFTASPSGSSVPNAPATARPDQQTYLDPEGWYSLLFPAELSPARPRAFATREGDYLETGYLPEMGYMSNILNVCAWLANVQLDPTQSVVDWSYLLSQNFNEEPQCSVLAKTSPVDNIQYQVYENPTADPAHRFAYVKTGWNSFRGQTLSAHFSWMKATSPRLTPSLAPLTPEEIALWERLAPTLQGISVTEYTLPPGADPNQQEVSRDLPAAAQPDWESMRAAVSTPAPPIETQLKSLGYELRQTDTGWKQLYRDGRLLFDFVVSVSEIYRFNAASGPVTSFIVNTRGASEGAQTSFLIQNDTVNAWDYSHQDPRFAPILHRDEILWVKASPDFNQVRIIKSDRETVFTYAVSTEPVYAVNKFVSWNGHWLLAARDFLIQDGEILNEKLGLEEIFSWGLIQDKPVYLFRKGPRIGVSYDGKVAPLNYQDVTRYRCCGYAANNPIMDGDSLHFYGMRDGIWYYVKVEFY